MDSSQILLPSQTLLKYVKQHVGAIIGTLLIMMVYMGGWALSGYALSHVLQNYSNKKWVIILVMAYVSILLADVGNDMLDSYMHPRLTDFVGKNTMKHVLKSYEHRRTSPDTGKLLSLYSNLHVNTTELLVKIRDYGVPFVVVILVASVYLFMLHKYLGGIMLGASLLYFGLYVGLCHVQVLKGNELENCRLDHENRASDILMNMHNIYAANMTARQLETFTTDLKDCSELQAELLQLNAGLHSALNVFIYIILLSLVICAAWLFKHKRLDSRQLTAFGFVLSFIWSGLDAPARHINNIAWYISYLNEADKAAIMLRDPSDEATGICCVAPADGTVSFANVTVGELALPDIELNDGDHLVIQGPIGSGKSTILNILFGKLRYTGVVRMGGLDVDQAEVSNWRKHIIFVPQTVTLFNDTVYYNVAYGNDASRQDVLAAMTKYQIFTIDLDTQVGRLGENLSGGQRQIIFLLRSYFRKNIKLVLMDEPTSALDANTRDNAMILINDIIKDRTAIIVTHDPSIVDLSTKTLTLETCN